MRLRLAASRMTMALLLCAAASRPFVVTAAPPHMVAGQAAPLVVVDPDGNLLVLLEGVLRPVSPPTMPAQALARFTRGANVSQLPGAIGEAGELVRSASGTLWWLAGESRHEVDPTLLVDDPLLLELGRGDERDLTGAEERAIQRLEQAAVGAASSAPPNAAPAQEASGQASQGATSQGSPGAVSTPTPAAQSAAVESALRETVAQARALIDRRQLDQAIALLTPHEGANSAEVLAALGEAYRWRSSAPDLRRSIDYFTRASALAPDVPRYYRGRAMAYEWLGRHTRPDAIADYQRAIDAAVRTGARPAAGDYAAMGSVLRLMARQTAVFDRGKLDDASRAATTAMGYDNTFTPAYVVRALAKASASEGGSAQDIEHAFRIDPGSTDPQRIAWHALAAYWSAFLAPDIGIQGRSGQYFSESWTYWDRYIGIIESDPARAATRDENWEALQVTPDWAYYYRAVAISWESFRDRDKVLADFERAIRINPREPAFYYQRGRYYADTNAPGQARNDLTTYFELMGQDDDGNRGEAAALMRRLGGTIPNTSQSASPGGGSSASPAASPTPTPTVRLAGKVIQQRQVSACDWEVTVEITGAPPGQRLQVSSTQEQYNCPNGINRAQTFRSEHGTRDAGPADQSGVLRWKYTHGAFASAQYTFTEPVSGARVVVSQGAD